MSDKYKMFKNYMMNELGITREDIKAWVEDAIKIEVDKIIGQKNLSEIMTRAVREACHEAQFVTEKNLLNDAATLIAKELLEKLKGYAT